MKRTHHVWTLTSRQAEAYKQRVSDLWVMLSEVKSVVDERLEEMVEYPFQLKDPTVLGYSQAIIFHSRP